MLHRATDFSLFLLAAADQSFLKYKEKEPYRYKVEGTSYIHTPSSLKGEGTQLNYVAAVDLVAESKCSFVLRVANIEITGPTGNVSADFISYTFTRYSFLQYQINVTFIFYFPTEKNAFYLVSVSSKILVERWKIGKIMLR